jgi:hypothetical protein
MGQCLLSLRTGTHRLRARATPELLQGLADSKLEPLFAEGSDRLGPMRKYNGSHGAVVAQFVVGHEQVMTGNYTACAQFERGTADFEVRVVQQSDSWHIAGFYIAFDQ